MAIFTSPYAIIPDLPSTWAMFPTRLSHLLNPLKTDSISMHKFKLSRSPRCASLDVSADLDLKLTIHRSSLITPVLAKAETRSMFLSNADRYVNFNISGLLFFRNNPSYTMDSMVDVLETAYRKLLVPYDYLAGRLQRDEQNRLQVYCNFAGAGLVVASSELKLKDLKNLGDFPRQDFKKFACRKLPGRHADVQPLFIIQITSLSCGGLVMGYSYNHMMFDGVGFKLYLENLASIARNDVLFRQPDNSRELLAARSPPQIDFPLTEFQKLEGDEPKFGKILSRFKKRESKVFRLSPKDIFKLKQEAMEGGCISNKTTAITTFDVIVAHVWRCMALASNEGEPADRTSTLLYAINFRNQMVPPLPDSYTGNAMTNAVCRSTYNVLKEGTFSELVHIVAEAEKKITDAYIRSSLDWTEVNQGFTVQGDVQVSSMLNMGYTDVVYPWGKAIWYSPVMPERGDCSVMLLPDTEGASGSGANVLVSLKPEEMYDFDGFFTLILRD